MLHWRERLAPCGHVVKAARSVAHRDVVLERDASERSALRQVGRVGDVDADERARVGLDPRPQHVRVHEREHGAACTDPKRERDNDGAREDDVLPDASKSEAQVCGQIVQQVDAARLPASILVSIRITEFDRRPTRRVLSRHSQTNEIVGSPFEMQPELFVHVALERRTVDQRAPQRSKPCLHCKHPRGAI